MLAIRLSKEMEARMNRLAKRTGRTKTFYARQALEEHIGDLEDLFIAEARLADIDAGRVIPLPWDEVRKGL
jgi:RHH-type transcriptional regulator, rel operon repressor / antitoxin RelB